MEEIIVLGQMDNKIDHTFESANRVYDGGGICPTIPTRGNDQVPKFMEIKNLTKDSKMRSLAEQSRAEQSRAEQSRAEQSSCLIRQATKEGVIECMLPGIADLEYPNSTTRRGRVQEKGQMCPTITTENIPNVLEEWIWEVDGEKYLIRIRKLTPRECGRLMGVEDDDISKILDVSSNTQAYKQFGNSIVVDVMENIFREMIPEFPMNPPIED